MNTVINSYVLSILLCLLSDPIFGMEIIKITSTTDDLQYCNGCNKGPFLLREMPKHLSGCDELKNIRSMLDSKGVGFVIPDFMTPEIFLAAIETSNSSELRKFFSEQQKFCPACRQDFSGWGLAASHFRIKHDLLPYPCNQCEESFDKEGAIKQHKRTRHFRAGYY